MTASERNHRQLGCTCERMAPHVWDAAGCEMHRYEAGVRMVTQDPRIALLEAQVKAYRQALAEIVNSRTRLRALAIAKAAMGDKK